jgi:hypothetical protein
MASRRPGTARIGSTLSQGLDGQTMIPASAAYSEAARTRRRLGGVRALEANGPDHWPALFAHEVFLKGERALVGIDHRAQRPVAHRQNAGLTPSDRAR